MAGLDLTAAANVLKTNYQGPLREQLNNANILLKRVRKNSKNYVGKEAHVPLHKGRNAGVGARAEGAALPTAGYQGYEKAIFTPKYIYGQILLNGPTIAAMKSDKGSFIRAMRSETKGLLVDMKANLNRQVWRDGSAILTRCGTTSAAALIVVESTKYISVGQVVAVLQIADGATDAGTVNGTVTAVNSATTFTISSADPATLTTSDADCVVEVGSRLAAAWGTAHEIFGIHAIVSKYDPGVDEAGAAHTYLTDDFGGIARATNVWWQANQVDAGTAAPLTLLLMQEAWDKCDFEAAINPGLIATDHFQKRMYGDLLTADKRYPAGGEITLDGGYRALEFNGTPLIADRDANPIYNPGAVLDRMYFIDMDALEWQLLEDFQWMDEDGAVLSRVSGYDQYEATMYIYTQFGADRCNSSCLLCDLAVT